ncbi:MAG: aldo/keto reductase [Xanthomonadales bacterium]|nr:aldo/keto reductase [Gammaproteobacteria bacterium]NND56973.1 aldo/keto reductase [Xanthomonadales bacterium]NNK51931.1 aldo/keto reductase [Xanthomonadales bacterium]
MKKRILGKSGFRVSEMGLGCWQLGGDFGPVSDDLSGQILRAAAESGIDFWDTADVYGGGQSESRIGRYLSANPSKTIVATKVGRAAGLFPDGYSRKKVRANIEQSARRLQVDEIDLVQLHCVPLEVMQAGDILAWLEDFQQEGLIRAFGASVETIEEAMAVISHPKLVSLQIVFNLFRQQAIGRLFPAARANDVGIVVRLPLASGVLGGKMAHGQQFAESDHRHYNREGAFFSQGETFSGVPFDTAVNFVEEMRRWLPEGMSMAQMAMRWILDYPEVSTVIAGATRPEQVLENAGISALAPLPAELHQKLADFFTQKVEASIVVEV